MLKKVSQRVGRRRSFSFRPTVHLVRNSRIMNHVGFGVMLPTSAEAAAGQAPSKIASGSNAETT